MRLAIFDVDGTLLDNLESEDACYASALRDGLGLPLLDTDWRTYEHVTDEGVAREAHERAFGYAPSADRIAGTIDRFVVLLADAHAASPLQPIAGAADLLTVLPQRGWLPALATGAWGQATRFKLAAAGLAVQHVPLATAEDGPARAAIVQAAWERALDGRAPFERVILVGDGVWDVATAQSLGLPFVGRATGERAVELLAYGTRHVLPDFSDIDQTISAFESAGVPLGAAPQRAQADEGCY